MDDPDSGNYNEVESILKQYPHDGEYGCANFDKPICAVEITTDSPAIVEKYHKHRKF